MTREVMQQALEALENAEKEGNCEYGATELLRAALAEPEQKPMAWITKWEHQGSRGTVIAHEKEKHHGSVEYIPLYTHPPSHCPSRSRDWKEYEMIDEIDIDKIIDANMTVTDHLLRDAIRGVVVAAMSEAEERERLTAAAFAAAEKAIDSAIAAEREACAKVAENGLIGHTIAIAIRARGEV